ncbi:DegV family protein [Erysipelothrix urinaevulpis]|uniref:DegV family protein n=1 Tax=Erysipelothrix urinaevulpis TaxID=2683717 RepID=UPI0013593B8E|nr:DegV family protein [Erysipelothrix urinaevulpis]
MKTAIVVDSGSNYFNEGINQAGLYAIPLQIIEGETSYLESIEISVDEVNDKMRRGIRVQTSLPILGEIESLFKKIKDDGYDQILAIPITTGLSGTIQAMISAASFADIAFDYFDCFTTMHIELYCGLTARRLLNDGHTVDEVKVILNDIVDHSNTFIIPDDLKHLSAGGRLSPLAAKLGGLLRIKPILHLDRSTKGIIDPFDKVRTMSRALERVVTAFEEEGVDENYQITLADVDNEKDAVQMEKLLKETFPKTEVVRIPLISTVSAHVGIGTIALQYFKKI